MSRLLLIVLAFLVGCASSTHDPTESEARKETPENPSPEAPPPTRLYVGTFTGGESTSEGIYVLDFDETTGTLKGLRLAAKAENPSFLAIHPGAEFLYAVGRPTGKAGAKEGAVLAYEVDPTSGALRLLNEQGSGGRGPCHVTVDATGSVVLVANYGGGSVAAYPIGPDGLLAESSAFVQHEGSSAHPKRQTRPHAHSINVDPSNRFALSADLGIDQVVVYRLDPSTGTLTANGAATVAPGSGPRHLAFHPDGTWAYVLNELNRTVTAFSFDAETGVLTELQTISSVPAGVTDGNSAEVRCSSDGRFLYTSNRGHDSIASFAIDATTGKLVSTGHVSTGGHWPRNFTLSPSGRWLLVANQKSDSIVVFGIDAETGVPTPTGQTVTVSAPVCLRFR